MAALSETRKTPHDVYTWLSEQDSPEQILKMGPKDQTVAYMKSIGMSLIARIRKGKEMAPIVKKGVSAFSFIAAFKGKIALNPYALQRISYVYRQSVSSGGELIVPSEAQVEAFSETWDQLPPNDRYYYDLGMSYIRQLVDPSPSEAMSQAFALASEYHKFKNDPEARQIHLKEIPDFISRKYPFLIGQIILGEIDPDRERMVDFTLRAKDPEVQRAATLISVARELAVANPSRMLEEIRLVHKNPQLGMFFEQLNGVFERFNSEDLELILSQLKSPSSDGRAIKPLLCLGSLLASCKNSEMDPWNASRMTPLQLEIWEHRERIVDLSAHLLIRHITSSVRSSFFVQHPKVHERVKDYISDRDEEGVTKQFKKDGDRYEQIVLTDTSGDSVQFPGLNTYRAAIPHLLERLKQMATIDGILDQDLFATLQEAVCQNLDKAATEQWLRYHLLEAFGQENLLSLIGNFFRRGCYKLQKFEAAPPHFMLTQEYRLRMANPHVASGDPVWEEHPIRLEYPIRQDQHSGWRIDQPFWTYMGDGPSVLAVSDAVPLPKVEGAAATAEQPVQPVGPAEKDEEDDEEVFRPSGLAE